ncbi:MAG: RAMP superfamily CRISPR-associated protein [Firmicutes bacterium]|nr:RAMP superfamily CRISPR-associated protein [Bacillota bacterium]
MTGNMKYQKVIKYLVTAVCTQPFHIGSASGDQEEVLVHPVSNVPFIQASGLAGVLRQYYGKIHGEAQAARLFGDIRSGENTDSGSGASRVRFSDGLFSEEHLILELRPRVSIDPKTGTCAGSTIKGTDRQAGHRFNTGYIGAGAEFGFSVYLYDDGFREELEETFSAVHQGNVQFGGQKSSGCGFMELKSLKRKAFDMKKAEDRRQWADEDSLGDDAYEDIFHEMQTPAASAAAYEVTVTGSTEGELLVKSIAVQDYGKDAPDSMNIRNAAKEYIVPGSSLKGAVRSQMEKIASYLGNGSVMEETFGETGNIVFFDAVVGNREDNDQAPVRSRIHLDKFTGGVIHGGLFNEKNVSGRVEFHMLVNDRNHPDSTCGLLLLALRDMAAGLMSVGSGYGVGKGFIDVERIVIRDRKNHDTATIEWEKGVVTDTAGIVSRCMKAVHRGEAAG